LSTDQTLQSIVVSCLSTKYAVFRRCSNHWASSESCVL